MKKNNILLNDKYSFSKKNMQYLSHYLNSPHSGQFLNPGIQEMNMFDNNGNSYLLDPINEYVTNENGYRDLDFNKKDSRVLAVGCSHTFGTGLPKEATWPEILKDKLNIEVSNLSAPGSSVHKLCKDVIKYCEAYKKPEYIFCLFPDFFRILFFEDPDFHIRGTSKNNKFINNQISLSSVNNKIIGYDDFNDEINYKKPKKYIKSPFELEYNISPHQYLMQSIDAIFFLEQYCKSNNIKLFWTTWDINTKSILNKLFILKNFELEKYFDWKEIPNNTENPNDLINYCTDNHNSKFYNSELWDKAADRYHNNLSWTHPGIHYQHHVADFFKQFMEG